ncbi:DUF2971 domain-containing protein [Vibrio cholerae]|nr:DUF2971 domain-containing protein [Vibrio cholerae]
MNDEFVDSLYKYRSVDSFTLDIIANNRIFFAKPEMFNDPYDTEFNINTHVGKLSSIDMAYLEETYGTSSNDEVDRVIVNVNEQIKNYVSSAGILSLSSSPENLLLWAHYADDHKGICIEFERKLGNDLANESFTQKVKYAASYPSFNKYAFIKKNGHSVVNRILWTKSPEWEYEQEWRVIYPYKGGTVQEIPGKIKSIIFGLRCPSINIDIIKRLVSGTDIKLKQASKKKNEFGVVIKNITSNSS